MKAILVDNPGSQASLRWDETQPPGPLAADEVRIQVAATAVNRADLLQRRGMYPPPAGASPILGLECSGTIVETGADVSRFHRGDRVMALLAGGGYAEEVVVHAGSVMPVPEGLSLAAAAALPETFITAFLNIFQLGHPPPGGAVLVHGGGSGVGTAAIQLGKAAGLRVLVTAGSSAKCDKCLKLGATRAFNYRTEDFVAGVRQEVPRGVDVVLDCVAGDYIARDIECLRTGGRLVVIGLSGGARVQLNLASLLTQRLHLVGSTLRSRSAADKAAIVSAFWRQFAAPLQQGSIAPVIDRIVPIDQAELAHRVVQASEHFGKVVLQVA